MGYKKQEKSGNESERQEEIKVNMPTVVKANNIRSKGYNTRTGKTDVKNKSYGVYPCKENIKSRLKYASVIL